MGQTKRENDDVQQKLKHYRLSETEYQRIAGLLGREPQGIEWALFSAMWSEHCSYKSSRVHLKGLFNKSPRVLESFGENAGVVDLGDGERIAFKIESHNHPSFIEPYQGAATGVGGILRDIFTMGARPIAIADYLCFGRPSADRMEKIVDGVVRGIGGYGNPVGVATISGQTEFHSSYDKNVLVNAMAVGLFRKGEKVFLSKAKGVGNLVVYAGAKTGRDGVHGASMASESFGKDSEKKKPTIQIGDPFFEKLLIEACLEVMEQDLVVAIQDMGAAGLTSSSFEMASKGGVGFNLHLDRVPLRESSLQPEDILLSESQERMLLVVEPKKLAQVAAVFNRWGLEAVAIGDVTEKKTMRLHWKSELLTEIDPELLTEHAPLYERPFEAWTPKNRVASLKELGSKDSRTPSEVLLSTLSSIQGCSREFIYRQYDGHVGAATAADCHDSVGVIRLKDSGRGLGIVLGCRPQMMRLDAREGGLDAVAYPALELASKGFEPLATTDCLNFGNPESVEVMSSFVASLAGMNEICRALVTPIISGNVSFYNETEGRGISPTPSTGIVGLRSSVDHLPTGSFTKSGENVFLVRLPLFTQNGAIAELKGDAPKAFGSLRGLEIAQFAISLRRLTENIVSSTRVVGKFGLAYALARMTMKRGLGVIIENSNLQAARPELSVLSFLDSIFFEVNYEVIVVSRETESEIRTRWNGIGGNSQSLHYLGKVGGSQLVLGDGLKCEVESLKTSYENGWTEAFKFLPARG